MRGYMRRRLGAARFFEPEDRFVGTRLQQIDAPDLGTKKVNGGIAWLRRMACCKSGSASSIDPVLNLPCAMASNAKTALGLDARTISYSGMASPNQY